jgi:hypothetical protein
MMMFDVGGVRSVLYVSVLLTITSATITTRHFAVCNSFDNKVFNPNDGTGHTEESLTDCSALCDEDCDCFGFNIRSKMCRILRACSSENVSSEELGWRYYKLGFPGEYAL